MAPYTVAADLEMEVPHSVAQIQDEEAIMIEVHEVVSCIERTLARAGIKARRKVKESGTLIVDGSPAVQLIVFEDGDVSVSWRNKSVEDLKKGRAKRRSILDALRGNVPEGVRLI